MSRETRANPSRTRVPEAPRLLAALALLVLPLCPLTLAEEKTKSPERGFHAGGSYAFSDIETISSTSGNLMLKVPLGGLPAGRGGISAAVNLHYNGKLWDQLSLRLPYNPDPSEENRLTLSQDGGWRYGFHYRLKIDYRRVGEDLGYCSPEAGAEGTYPYLLNLVTPDGAEHPLRLDGYTDGDYQNVWPDGRPACTGGPTAPGTLTYYTTDGTYLRLDVEKDPASSGTDAVWENNPWTLYLPDGGRVTGGNAPQRIHDRNGNYVEILNGTYNGHSATYINDQVGRSVIIEYGYAADKDAVRARGVGDVEMVWLVQWRTIKVNKTYFSSDRNQAFPLAQFIRVVDKVYLPSQAGNLFYTFDYNATAMANPSSGWGEINSVTLPSGAQATYQYLKDNANGSSVTAQAVLKNRPTQKTLSYNAVYDGVSTPVTETWGYATTYDSFGDTAHSCAITGPGGGVTTEHFNKDEAGQINETGEVYKSEMPDGTVVERQYATNTPQGAPSPDSSNRYVRREFTSIKGAGAAGLTKTAVKEYSYDKNGNVTQVAEYDWVPYAGIQRDGSGRPTGFAGTPPAPKRVTVNTYYRPTPDASDATTADADSYHKATSPRLKRAAESSEVRSGFAASAALSRTEYTYDNPATTGNVTQQRSWDSTKGALARPLAAGTYVFASTQYDAHGSPTLSTDARGVQTQLAYGAVSGPSGAVYNLYRTETKAASGTAIQRRTTSVYDFYTGAVTTSKDEDNNVSTVTTYDVFGRPTLVKSGVRSGATLAEETHTATEYSDVLRRVITRSDLTNLDDGKLVTVRHYDQLGRLRLARTLEDAATQSATDESAGIKVQTRYLTSGGYSYVLSSQPYRAATSGGAGEPTRGWSRTKLDAGGRVVEEQTFQGSGLPAPWHTNASGSGAVTTAYDAEYTTVTDQAGKVRRSRVDGLGRLARVDEPTDAGGLGTTSSPNQATSYFYDAAGNLRRAEQGAQSRFFAYDSLGRLLRVKNPEQGAFTADADFPALTDATSGTSNSQWSMGYVYDAGGNLLKRKDARNVVSTYAYDALGRNTSVAYAGETGCAPNCTPQVTRRYDSAVNGKGLLWQTETGGPTGTLVTVGSYDALGRPRARDSQFYTGSAWGAAFSSARTYGRAGNVLSETYPSGRSVSYAPDAAGRLSTFSGNLGDGAQRTYASDFSYDEQGRRRQEKFGTTTPVYNKSFFNASGQLSEMRVSTHSITSSGNETNWNRGAIINHYSNQSWAGTGTDNNGNLRKQDVYVPNDDAISGSSLTTQVYTYDSLNRLDLAREERGGVTQWQQDYVYDRWGNRTVDAAGTWLGSPSAPPSDLIPEKQFSLTQSGGAPATNRLEVPSGQSGTMTYDGAGNLIYDSYSNFAGGGSRTFDAEGRMTAAQYFDGQVRTAAYAYDADGRRVRRRNGLGVETWQVYGFGGELLAEYAAGAPPSSPQKEYGFRAGELLVTAEGGEAGSGALTNVALATNGGVASASSTNASYNVAALNNGDRKGPNHGGVWGDSTSNVYPDWVQIDFSGTKTISEVALFSVQDNGFAGSVEPTQQMTGSQYVVASFAVQYWTGAAWATVTGGSVTGNNLIWRRVTFPEVTTSKVRVVINQTGDNYSQVPEVEVYGRDARSNVALAASGGVASASSTSASHSVAALNNGDRRGVGYGGVWTDNTNTVYPDWVQVDFSGSKTIDEVAVVSMQNNYASPSEPTEAMTGTSYVVTDFVVEYWTGAGWAAVPGGTVTGNNKIWRRVTFPAVTTTKVRVVINQTGDNYSQLVELEAWGTGAGAGQVKWLVSDQLGTPRMVIDQTGSLAGVKRHDYLPFGEEIGAGTGGRTSTQGYLQFDGVRQHFTGKERDEETGLDYFGSRYHSGPQGRFTSVDPYNIVLESQVTAETNPEKAQAQFLNHLMHPQQLNLYAYVANNPLRYIDPTGEKLEITGSEEARKKAFERIKQMVGESAAKLLYVREENGHFYVDYHGKPGDGDRLAATSEFGVFIANIIDHAKTTEFQIATSFSTRNGNFSVTAFGGGATVGAEESLTGNTQIFVHPEAGDVTTEKFGMTAIGRSKSSDGRQLDFYDDIVDAHEFGHAYGNMVEGKPLKNSKATDRRAVQLENYIRQRRGLNKRTQH